LCDQSYLWSMFRSLWRRLASFRRPDGPALAEPPAVGDPAPERPRLGAGEPRVVLFLRHTGCAFGEHMLREFRQTARATPDVQFVAITHGDPEAATGWCEELGLDRVAVHNPDAEDAVDRWCRGTDAGNLRVIVDEARELYAEWGLGLGGLRHLLRPAVVRNLLRARRAGATDRTPSGTRWQRAGMFGVDPDGTVRTRYIADYAGDLPDIRAAPTFLDRASETTTPLRNATEDDATAEEATETAPDPWPVATDTVAVTTRVPSEPRVVAGEPAAAVRPAESSEVESEANTAEDTDEHHRQRLRTDGG
jgi:hypothetical protein